ncbi:hypothetical protein GBAR_LOCUS28935, partial [Geodia barretti]
STRLSQDACRGTLILQCLLSSVNNREPFYSPQKGFIQELRH